VKAIATVPPYEAQIVYELVCSTRIQARLAGQTNTRSYSIITTFEYEILLTPATEQFIHETSPAFACLQHGKKFDKHP